MISVSFIIFTTLRKFRKEMLSCPSRGSKLQVGLLRTLPSEPWKRGEQTACARCRPRSNLFGGPCPRVSSSARGRRHCWGWAGQPCLPAAPKPVCLSKAVAEAGGPGQSTEGDSPRPRIRLGVSTKTLPPPKSRGRSLRRTPSSFFLLASDQPRVM